MSRGLAAFLVVAAALTLPVAGGTLAAVAVSGAIFGVWMVGSAGGPRRRLDRVTSGGLALCLVSGTLLAAGLGDGPGYFGLPRSLLGLVLGIWLIPLLLTSAGFALSFRPPDAADLDRLRAESRHDP